MGKRNHLYRTGKGFGKVLKGKINFNLLDKFNENVVTLGRFKNVIDSFIHQSVLVNNNSKSDVCKYFIYKFLDSFPNERFVMFATNSFNQLEQSRIISNVAHSITSNTSNGELHDILKEFRSHITPGLLICHPLKTKLNIPFVKQIIHYDIPSNASDLVDRLSISRTKLEYDSDELLMGNSLIIHTKNDINEYNNLMANMSNKFQQIDVVDHSVLVKYFLNRYQNELITGINLKVDVSTAQLKNAEMLLRIHGISIVKSALHKLDKLSNNDAWRSTLSRRYNYASVLIRDPTHSVIVSRSHLKQLLMLHMKEKVNLVGNISHTNEGFVVEMPIISALELVEAPLTVPKEWDVQSDIVAEILKKRPMELESDRKRRFNNESIIKQIKRRLDRGYIGNAKTKRKLLKKLAAANERREIALLRRRARLGLLANKL
ncbi:hypothetical protein BMR1_01G02800 [Babesia microti strain RI]|uniref:Uncharacterized protein n=1 Tax=Babesia microti (strain RI) TaxID=1133968 RepID=A0A1N6LX12_BABMR|nr:hypothetical protein BMR1_01G02800 [Babesia microti strain RI]SIO73418.1 hypothetical protein BMR1_01G02800 [Babesia microti strain RI]|eukprot:XP_021337517.1 hypothetical protein BMR1_01G02800 [Babesia microti strain RI]